MAKKKTSRRARQYPPVPPIYKRLTDSLLTGCVRSGAGCIYAAPHNVHPNNNPDVVEQLDIADFRALLHETEDEYGRTIRTGQDRRTLYAVCSMGMKTEEEAVLDLMRGWYQVDRQTRCRVHFYVRDTDKEYEIDQWRRNQ